jgi:hypothetical protein
MAAHACLKIKVRLDCEAASALALIYLFGSGGWQRMAADETDGEADWLGKSLQTVTASLTVQEYRFSNSATALGVSETGIMSEDVCKKDTKADFNCVRYTFPKYCSC